MINSSLHPADALVLMMERIYKRGLTTTSGGNLSILDDNGAIWITPSGIDKGSLRREDISLVKNDGTIIGRHKPSVELPFHKLVYEKRPDLRAVVHAHPPNLVAFSVVRKIPNLSLCGWMSKLCGSVGYTDYAVPGSVLLGENIAQEFAKGYDIIVLENHGVCAGGTDIFEAYKKFEALEHAAQIEINAGKIGKLQQLDVSLTHKPTLSRLRGHISSEGSCKSSGAKELVSIIKRSYEQRLFTTTSGTISYRIDDNNFLINSTDSDPQNIYEDELILVGIKEGAKSKDNVIKLHSDLYTENPWINSIIKATPPNAMAFAVSDAAFDLRTIPESIIVLRGVNTLTDKQYLKDSITKETPVVICKNDFVLAVGETLIKAFDRIEVIEATAKSIILAKDLGNLVNISDKQVQEIKAAFN